MFLYQLHMILIWLDLQMVCMFVLSWKDFVWWKAMLLEVQEMKCYICLEFPYEYMDNYIMQIRLNL